MKYAPRVSSARKYVVLFRDDIFGVVVPVVWRFIPAKPVFQSAASLELCIDLSRQDHFSKSSLARALRLAIWLLVL